MSVENTEDATPTVVSQTVVTKPCINPTVKRILMWGAIAAGVVLGAILLDKTRDLEEDVELLAEATAMNLDTIEHLQEHQEEV